MKKTLALGMAAAMTATLLAGCGGSSSSAASSAAASTAESTASSTAAASTAESTGSYTDYSAGFPENVTIQIPVYDRGFENWNPTDNYYTRWIQSEFGDKYNVTVKYVAIARSNEVQDGSLYPNQTVTAADFLAVLIPGAAGRRPLADAVSVPDSVPVYARRAVGQAVAEGLIAPEALTKPLNRSNAAEICRRLHI